MEDTKRYNEVDMECDVRFLDDDDFGFGSISDSKHMPEKIITADITPSGALNIQNNFKSSKEPDYSKYNPIDMECEDFDDTEDMDLKLDVETFDKIYDGKTSPSSSERLDFGDDEENIFFENHFKPEDISEDEILERSILHKNQKFTNEDLNLSESSKEPIGQVSADYWRKLAKKHAATNKKGARGYFELFGAFDPKRNMELFNHDATPQFNPKTATELTGGVTEIASTDASGEVAVSSGEGGAVSGGEGGGMGESLKEEVKTLDHYLDLFDEINFKVTENRDHTYRVEDRYECEEIKNFDTLKDVLDYLKPFIMDEFGLDESEVEEYIDRL